jgi:hypothetical protein
MCPQTPRLSPEYSHKVGLQTVITEAPLQTRPVTHSGHAGPVTMGRITRGPPCWTRPHGEMTSSQVFVRCRMERRVSLPVVLSPLGQRPRRRPRAKGGVFAFAPTHASPRAQPRARVANPGGSTSRPRPPSSNGHTFGSPEAQSSPRSNLGQITTPTDQIAGAFNAKVA